jgi:hypothetical protein
MLAATAKTKRFLEGIQFGLTFISVCAVLEASRIPSSADPRPAYYAGVPSPDRSFGDRRLCDLARTERKRREAEQQSSRRRGELGTTLQELQLHA